MTLDPEMAIWTPGKKRIFLPAAPQVATDRELGISIRLIREFNIVPDRHPSKIDVWFGYERPKPNTILAGSNFPAAVVVGVPDDGDSVEWGLVESVDRGAG